MDSRICLCHETFLSNFINGLAGVQFIHRTFAYLVFGLIVYLFIKSKKFDLNKIENTAINILLITVFIQMVLGIITLVLGVPIWLGVIHQLGAFILLASTVFCLFIFKKTR